MKKHPLASMSAGDCINYLQTANPKKQQVTIDRIRRVAGYENYTVNQAAAVIDSLVKLAHLAIELAAKNSLNIDNQYVVSLPKEHEQDIDNLTFNHPKAIAA